MSELDPSKWAHLEKKSLHFSERQIPKVIVGQNKISIHRAAPVVPGMFAAGLVNRDQPHIPVMPDVLRLAAPGHAGSGLRCEPP